MLQAQGRILGIIEVFHLHWAIGERKQRSKQQYPLWCVYHPVLVTLDREGRDKLLQSNSLILYSFLDTAGG